MGQPTTPQEAAPAYDEVMHLHQYAPAGSSSGYAQVPQDDVEQDAPLHNHTAPSPAPCEQQESLAQTIAGVFRPKPHVHCEACDKQQERREQRANERHCCSMVAWVFIILFICAMVLGIVVVNATTKERRHGHD